MKGMGFIFMKCQNCGNEIRAEAAFCTGCGTRVERDTAPGENVIAETKIEETATVPLQAPSVSSIPAPPQMPDLPVPPTISSDMGATSEPFRQSENIQKAPDVFIPPAQPTGVPATLGTKQTFNNYAPPQNYDQQQYQSAPVAPSAWGNQPPPWKPPTQTGPKKVNTGLIIGLAAGGVVLLVIAIIVGLSAGRLLAENMEGFEQSTYASELPVMPAPETLPSLEEPIPAPDPPTIERPVPPMPETPPPALVSDNKLVGMWALDDGDPLWFFGRSDFIMIIDYDDGTFGVYENGSEEWGHMQISDDGRLYIEGEWSGDYEFTYRLDGDRLTIIDIDGDEAHFDRME